MIEEWAKKQQLPNYRVKQFNLAYYQQLIESWQELTTWPIDLRNQLELELPFSTLKPITELTSKDGKTIKVLMERADGTKLESVLMRFKDGRNSVCVSCMVGCPVGCTFCATGKMGWVANLSAREIVEQVMFFSRMLKKPTAKQPNSETEKITNVVFMGMGEPMLNLEPVMEAVEKMTNPGKLGLGDRHITISTSGYVPQIRELIKRGFKGRLAVSLHAPNQKLREVLMPTVAKVYPLDQLMAVLDEYATVTNKRISYEYAMIAGVNDGAEQAKELARLLKGRLAHVNLIPYNVVGNNEKEIMSNEPFGKLRASNEQKAIINKQDKNYRRSSRERIRDFALILRAAGIPRTIRLTMGDDIAAACGQLANQKC